MYVQILAISCLLMMVYLLFSFFRREGEPFLPQQQIQFHMGCYSNDNELTQSQKIRQFLSKVIKQENHLQNYQLERLKTYSIVSNNVASDFQKYLGQYYNIKNKGIFEQNFYRSLGLAHDSYQQCKQKVFASFNKTSCQENWLTYFESKQKFEQFKKTLEAKIRSKEEHERKFELLLVNSPQTSIDEFDKNISSQIRDLNVELQNIGAKKIEISKKRFQVQEYISKNQSKVDADQKFLNECLKNIKIVTFCNDLTKQLNSNKFISYSKQDIEKRIQRKQQIIETFKQVIRNAQRIGKSEQQIQTTKNDLIRNQKQLEVLVISLDSYQAYEESYCSKCSSEKISELKIKIQETKNLIVKHRQEVELFIKQEEKHNLASLEILRKIQQIEAQRNYFYTTMMCQTVDCKEKKLRQINELSQVLNQMRKEIIDYKRLIHDHEEAHSLLLLNLNKQTRLTNIAIECLYKKQYFEELRDKRPENENQIAIVSKVKSRLLMELKALGE